MSRRALAWLAGKERGPRDKRDQRMVFSSLQSMMFNEVPFLDRFAAAVGLDPADLRFENGAGLSRSGRVSPRALVALLARTREEGSPAAALMPTLASAGGEGTLRMRLTGGDGRVRGKTGPTSGVSALSGAAASPPGRAALGFSVLINGDGPARSHRRLQDRVVLALLGHLDGGS